MAVATFEDCVRETLDHPGFLREYDRLNNTSFSKAGIIQQIDIATGKMDADARELIDFIHKYIWIPYIRKMQDAGRATHGPNQQPTPSTKGKGRTRRVHQPVLPSRRSKRNAKT